MIRGKVRRDPGHLLEVHPAQVDASEVDGDQEQEQDDGQRQGELNEALAARS